MSKVLKPLDIFMKGLFDRADRAGSAGGVRLRAVVAIPASNEAERIGDCLAALAIQRDRFGAPLPAGSFAVLLYANGCTDGTAVVAQAFAANSPHPIVVVSEMLSPERSNAGWARKRAMDLAADHLREAGCLDGVILTTDGDSIAAATWVSATLDAFARGADCVAGYIDAHPAEIVRLGPAFLRRARLEDAYLSAVAEIHALCDPRPHDPWPNHRVSSGASLAVTVAAYLSIGGLPPKPVGEDAALTHALECAGFAVRHAMDVCVSTSCRFDGRAQGGAADTMRYRHQVLDAPCDDDLEPALGVTRRALCKGTLRRLAERDLVRSSDWAFRLRLPAATLDAMLSRHRQGPFAALWNSIEMASPVLSRRVPLRPADLPHQIERARTVLRYLRGTTLTLHQPVETIDRVMQNSVVY